MLPLCILAIEDESDREFMTELFIQYNKLMYKTISNLVHSHEDVEDIMQSTLEKLIDKIPTIRELTVAQRVNYILSACRRTAYNANRDKARHLTVPLNESFDVVSEESVSDAVIHHLDMQSLMHIWNELDEQTRYLLNAKYLLDISDSEIAAYLGISSSSVRTYLTRARRRAYELMEREQ